MGIYLQLASQYNVGLLSIRVHNVRARLDAGCVCVCVSTRAQVDECVCVCVGGGGGGRGELACVCASGRLNIMHPCTDTGCTKNRKANTIG